MERRRLTVGYDVLTDLSDLATRIVAAAVHLDRHGCLPDGWAEFGLHPATRPVPVVEIEVPGL